MSAVVRLDLVQRCLHMSRIERSGSQAWRRNGPLNPLPRPAFHSALKTVTVGFPAPLHYSENLKLSVTVNEPNVAQIVGNVIHGA
jgi:hypothetical protein